MLEVLHRHRETVPSSSFGGGAPCTVLELLEGVLFGVGVGCVEDEEDEEDEVDEEDEQGLRPKTGVLTTTSLPLFPFCPPPLVLGAVKRRLVASFAFFLVVPQPYCLATCQFPHHKME